MSLNSLFNTGAAALFFLLLSNPAAGQEQESGSSALTQFIASHCSHGSGLPVENYLGYGASLEKTLSTLTPDQQAYIFGYELTAAHNAVNRAGKTNSSGGGHNDSQTALPEEEQPSLLDRLVSTVESILP